MASPRSSGNTYRELDFIFSDPGRSWFDLVGLIPKVLAENGGRMEFSALDHALHAGKYEGLDIEQLPFRIPLVTSLVRSGSAMLAVQRGDAVKAQENYDVLTSVDTTPVSPLIVLDRVLGLLAQSIGEPNAAYRIDA